MTAASHDRLGVQRPWLLATDFELLAKSVSPKRFGRRDRRQIAGETTRQPRPSRPAPFQAKKDRQKCFRDRSPCSTRCGDGRSRRRSSVPCRRSGGGGRASAIGRAARSGDQRATKQRPSRERRRARANANGGAKPFARRRDDVPYDRASRTHPAFQGDRVRDPLKRRGKPRAQSRYRDHRLLFWRAPIPPSGQSLSRSMAAPAPPPPGLIWAASDLGGCLLIRPHCAIGASRHRRQRRHLARFHRSRFHRSAGHRLQPHLGEGR